MSVCLCYSVLFLRFFYLCSAKAVDLGLIYNRQAKTVSPSALIECTPANCSAHSECGWKYCPITGYVPKCVEGNYSSKCCTCADEWPNIKSMMMSSFKEGYHDTLVSPPTKICDQLFKLDFQSRTDKLTQLYQKIASKRLKNMGKKKKYLEEQIKKLHRKKMRLNQIGRNYDFLTTTPTSSDSDATTTEDGVNDYISQNIKTNVLKNTDGDAIRSDDSNVLISSSNYMMNDYKAHLNITNDTKSKTTKAVTMKKDVVKSNATAIHTREIIHYKKKGPKYLSNDSDEKQVIKGDNHVPGAQQKINFSKNYEPKVIMGDKLVG